ncbi:hypothetical protein [Hyalangium versicolor]|uniref:hypothetical protein n=1 Tax=Hyalangium versicolor TaxID=2861190 RepID=UPI001CCF1EE8|nr:hypothetical protein [Hyalangium versicolor]
MKPALRHARRPAAARKKASAPLPAGAVLLATVVAEESGGWRVRIGTQEQVLPLDASVDPALMRQALEEGARVLVENSGTPSVVGVVQTSRSLRVDRQGVVDAVVERFSLHARLGATLQTSSAFMRVKGSEVELYGTRVLTRAREVAKMLARMISLN